MHSLLSRLSYAFHSSSISLPHGVCVVLLVKRGTEPITINEKAGYGCIGVSIYVAHKAKVLLR